MHFNCGVVLKSNYRYTENMELLQVYFRYNWNILHLKTDIIQRSYNPDQ